jgi:drug/metabolite transporter (DMT)-like permease
MTAGLAADTSSPPSAQPLIASAALLLIVQLFFSLYAVLGSAAFKSGTSPVVFALLRDFVACSCFIPSLYFEESRRPVPVRRFIPRTEHAFFFFALALTGVWGSQLMSALAIANLSAPIYGMMKPCVPVVTLIVAVFVGQFSFDIRARASQLVVGGVILAVSGAAYIVVASAVDSESKNAMLGAGYISLYLCLNGTYPIVQKHVLNCFDYSPLFVTTWTYMTGTGLILMSALVAAPPASQWHLNAAGVGGVIFSGVLATFFNYAAMAWVNKRTEGVFVSSFFPLQSFLTPLLSTVILDAQIMPSDYAGGSVIVIGLACCIAAQMLTRSARANGDEAREGLMPAREALE